MKNNRPLLVISIGLLLILNLGAGILVKVSPAYYGNPVLMCLLITGVLGLYFVQTLMWLYLGRHYQLSFVYPFLGVGYVLSLFVGMAIFHEPFILRRLIGAIIIVLGVAFLSFSKHRDDVPRMRLSG